MHNQHRSPDPTKIERATATSTVALFFYFSLADRIISLGAGEIGGSIFIFLAAGEIGGLRDLDILTPHEAHHSSRIMRSHHTHFGVPLGNTTGWWDDRKRNQKSVLPLYLRLDIPSNLSRALSCLRLSGHNFLVQRMRHDRNRSKAL